MGACIYSGAAKSGGGAKVDANVWIRECVCALALHSLNDPLFWTYLFNPCCDSFRGWYCARRLHACFSF
jgi:hypothetical protein